MFIVNNDQLKQFYQECQKDKNIAIDTEFYWTNTYKPILCLIQIANPNKTVIIDPFINQLNLNYVKRLLTERKILKIFHSAKQDIQIFYNLFGILPKNIFDIQIGVLPLGYNNSTGLKTICKDFLDINLNKNIQFIDWRNRPLTKIQIDYAKNDVRFLIRIYKKIILQLKKMKRESWILEFHKKLTEKSTYIKNKTAWEKVNYYPKHPDELKFLKKLCEIREIIAMDSNTTVKSIIGDKDIIRLCKISIKYEKKKEIIENVKSNEFKKMINLFEFQKQNHNLDIDTKFDRDLRVKVEKVKKIIEEKANHLNVPANMIASKKEIVDLVKCKNIFFFKGWKKKIIDKNLLRIIKG